MNPRVKSSLLWGLVGALAFLVLVQGYELLTEGAVAATLKVGVAIAVGVVATVGTHLLRPWLLARLDGSEAESESP